MPLDRRPSPAIRSILGAIVWALGTAACARQDAPERSIEQLRADITKVQADRDRLEERVIALENAEERRSGGGDRRSGKMSDGASEGRVLPVVRIGAQGEARSVELDAGGDDRDGSAARPFAAAGSRKAGRDQGRQGKAVPDGKRDFEAAVALARTKQYDKALDGLTAFLVRYPDHEYSDQAMYWRGECFFGLGANERAAEQLQGLVARFPLSDRVPYALLRLGLAQQRLGAIDQAQRTFTDLKQRYPKSDAAGQAPRL